MRGMNGIDSELSALISSSLPYVRRRCRRLGLPTHEAEDIVQEVALSFYRNRHRIKSPESWFRAAARTRCLMTLRRQVRKPTFTLDPISSTFRAPDLFSRAENRLDAAKLLSVLNPRWRRLFVLLAMGYRWDEVARAIGISPNSVGQMMKWCRGRISRSAR